MKIAILSCFYPYRGGIAQFNAALMEELGKTHQVRAFNFKRQYPGLLFPGKTQFVQQDDVAERVESTPVLDTINPLSWLSTVKAIGEWKPDVVVMRYWMSWFAPSLGFVARRLRKKGIKIVSILDNVIPHEPHFFDTPLTRYFLKGSTACITLCDAVRQDLEKIAPGKAATVIPHPLYTHFGERLPREKALADLGLTAQRKTLLYFGLIREYKGLDILLESFSQLGDDYQLIIAGEAYGSFEPYRKQIEAIAKPERIHLSLKYIKDSEVAKYFSAADLCVLPYRSATQSGVSAIAFHFGLPMLVTPVGGLKETIADSGAGLLSEDCSPEAILRGIERFFSDSTLRQGCIQNTERLRQRLSWANFAKQMTTCMSTLH